MSAETLYDCGDCVAFCCTGVYAVSLAGVDYARLALKLEVSPAELKRKYMTDGVTLRKKEDPIGGTACVFLDTTERRCTVYSARPEVCRVWPRPEHAAPGAVGRCAFYDLYTHLRNELEPEAMPLVQIVRVQGSAHPATRPNEKRRAG